MKSEMVNSWEKYKVEIITIVHVPEWHLGNLTRLDFELGWLLQRYSELAVFWKDQVVNKRHWIKLVPVWLQRLLLGVRG